MYKSYYSDESIDDDPNLSPREKHRLRRQKIEQERAERQRLENERIKKRNQKKKSSEILAKWYLTGGIKIAGTAVRGMFYGGANMKDMVQPNLIEPSLLNPVEAVADTSDGMEQLGNYPMYQYLSPQQRRGYIDFLASDRTTATDIGFVFLYLYGLERRLIIDAQKPGEVSDDEKVMLTNELVRLRKCFGDQSASLAHYIAMLLLYDGTVFDLLPENEIIELFDLKNPTTKTKIRGREYTDNADALSYMLLARLKSHDMNIPLQDYIAAAKGRLIRGNAGMLGITKTELYEEALDRAMMERVSYCDFKRLREATAHSIDGIRRPTYYPSSPMIRKGYAPEITANICPDPEPLGIPIKGLSDILVTCKKDLDDCRTVLNTISIRDINRIRFDLLDIVSNDMAPEEMPLNKFLANKSGATYVPMHILNEDCKARYKTKMIFTTKNVLSSTSQHLVAAAAASTGWQVMFPDIIEGMIPSMWKIDENTPVVMFYRGTAHNKVNGKRCIGPIFGHDEQSYVLSIPGSWNEVSALAFVFAWFIQKCPETLDKSMLTHYSASHYPPYSTSNGGNKRNQIAFFFSLLHATYSTKISGHSLKTCVKACKFENIRYIIFALCNEVYGTLIPPEAMVALEEIYQKAGEDPTMILYDYHAGSYKVTDANATGFVIDEEKLADVLADTDSVHSMLNEAMSDDEEEENDTADTSTASVDTINTDAFDICNTGVDENNDIADTTAGQETSNGESSVQAIYESIRQFFGDSDEGNTEKLLSYLVDDGHAATTAEAMKLISAVNDEIGEDTVEIDGADVYLNI